MSKKQLLKFLENKDLSTIYLALIRANEIALAEKIATIAEKDNNNFIESYITELENTYCK